MLPPDRNTSYLPVMLVSRGNSVPRGASLKLVFTHLLSTTAFFSLGTKQKRKA